jgi:hypothetical protein
MVIGMVANNKYEKYVCVCVCVCVCGFMFGKMWGDGFEWKTIDGKYNRAMAVSM